MTNIERLPDLPLLLIFDKLSTFDLLHNIPLVCKRWTGLQAKSCQGRKYLQISDLRLCYRKQTLSLYEIDHKRDLVFKYKHAKPSWYDDNDGERSLQIKLSKINLDDRTCLQFCDKFSNVTHLCIGNEREESSNIVVAMLSAWANKLTHLKIVGDFEWTQLKEALDQLTALKCLSSNIDIHKANQLSIVDQLEVLNCRIEQSPISEPPKPKVDLNRLFGRENIHSFGLEQWGGFNDVPLEDELWPKGILTKLTRLKAATNTELYLDQLCTKCQSLTYLNLTCFLWDLKYDKYFSKLSQLSKLTELKIHFIRIDKWNTNLTLDKIQNLPSFDSVKKAQIRFVVDPHLWPVIAETLFPNAAEPIDFKFTLFFEKFREIPSCGFKDCDICKMFKQDVVPFTEKHCNFKFYVKDGKFVGWKHANITKYY